MSFSFAGIAVLENRNPPGKFKVSGGSRRTKMGIKGSPHFLPSYIVKIIADL